MNTYSHFLMTALAGDRLKRKEVAVHTKAALLGSILPDVPLVALTLGYFAYRYWLDPLAPGEHIYGPRYDNLYFSHPVWVIGHSLFHAPLLIALYLGVGYAGLRRHTSWGLALVCFALACALHAAVDIFTHHDDGPLLLFPFSWSLRFPAPVSYWDPNHYGWLFGPLELVFDLAIVAYFAINWWRARLAAGFWRKA